MSGDRPAQLRGPLTLPGVRDQLAAVTRGAVDALGLDPALREVMTTTARLLRAADLYWVTESMTHLAMSASSDLPDWSPIAAQPSPVGLLVWEQGLPELPWWGAPRSVWAQGALGPAPPTAHVRAVSWWPTSTGIEISLYAHVEELPAHALTQTWAGAELFGCWSMYLDPLQTPQPQGWAAGVVAALGATWLLMSQPGVADDHALPADERTSGAYQRAGRQPPTVRLIDLRRATAPARDKAGAAIPSREYTRRWMVRGHWRQQAVGPGRAQRRPTWISPHVKGPPDAALLAAEHVHVWRR